MRKIKPISGLHEQEDEAKRAFSVIERKSGKIEIADMKFNGVQYNVSDFSIFELVGILNFLVTSISMMGTKGDD